MYNVLSRVSPQCNGFVATRALEHIMCHKASHYGDNRKGTLFSRWHIYYVHLASVRFEHSVSPESLMTIYIIYMGLYIIYIGLYKYLAIAAYCLTRLPYQ